MTKCFCRKCSHAISTDCLHENCNCCTYTNQKGRDIHYEGIHFSPDAKKAIGEQ